MTLTLLQINVNITLWLTTGGFASWPPSTNRRASLLDEGEKRDLEEKEILKMVSLESVTSCEPCNLAWVPKMVLANHPWQRVLDNAQNILVKISMQGLYSPLSYFRPEVARIECQLPVSRSQPTPPRPQSSAKKICKQLTPADIMLGAATRAASGLVRQSIAGNVSKALPAVANRKLAFLFLLRMSCHVKIWLGMKMWWCEGLVVVSD